jgi:16S rRNA processing protein RimM
MDYVYVGTIVGTHGIRGEVKVRSNSDFKAERFRKNNTLYVRRQGEMVEIVIDSHRTHKDFDLITFNHLTNINDVLDYVNCDLYIHKDQLRKLAADEYYYHELVGLTVCDKDGIKIGVVADVTEYPQGAMLVVDKPDGGQALIPFVSAFVKSVDLEKRLITITPIEGLL